MSSDKKNKKFHITNLKSCKKRLEIDFLGKEYPEIKIDFIIEKAKFSPSLIKELSQKWNIPINFMFIGSPSDKFPYKIQELGGVRLII